jgi:2-polyprenyl-6-methoxyphenol hydroxylase-like FAD-dependent oxidoreductase
MTSSAQQLSDKAHVLVVGAGPVGLATAVVLRMWGADVLVLDRDPEPITASRAVWIHPRTTELLHGLGVAERARAQGVLMDRVEVHRGAASGGSIPYDGRGRTRFPEGLVLEQCKLQHLLLDRAEELGVRVRWNTRVCTVDETGDAVHTSVQVPGSADRRIETAWVVGADGAGSTVREQVGLELVGDNYATAIFTADLVMRTPLSRRRGHLSVTIGRTFALLPLPGDDRWRVVGTVPADVQRGLGRDAGPTGGPALDIVQVRSLLSGLRIEHDVLDVEWATLFRSHHRVVDTYRAGRVFLAGDAAHIHSPAGGLGMNTGIGDAVDLGWRLGLALRHGPDSAEGLLDTYSRERRGVACQVLRTSDRAFTIQAGSGPVLGLLRTVLMPAVPGLLNRTDAGRRLAFELLSQIGVSYRTGRRRRDLAVGDRLPLATASDGSTSHDLMAPDRFVLLVVGEGSPDGLMTVAAEHDLPVVAQRLPSDDQIRDALRLPVATALLVRPDGHIGWLGDVGDTRGLASTSTCAC